jgi:hypothetical protein
MQKQYSLVSKINNKHGRSVLVSFASKPMWKSYENLRREKQTPGNWDKNTANYALNKYANNEGFEVLPYSEICEELDKYKTDFPNWQ